VISHLRRGPLGDPQRDENHYKDVVARGARPPLTDADLLDVEGAEGADPGRLFEQ
jgi:hypothetical protein